MDKTSAELPTEILHQILSLLPTKTAARTALLSKSWLKACSTKPHLCFDISDPVEYRAHEFLRIVDNTLESIFCCPIVEVEIVDAPKLLSFEYVNKGDSTPYLSSDNLHICLRTIEIGTCQNLRRVEFVKVTVEYWDLFKIIQKLHSVKELILHYCRYLRKIKISSSTLEVCSIVQCDLVEEAIFDTPKLLSLAFSDQDRLPSLSFERAPSQCRVSIKIDILWDVQHLMNLRRFLVELCDQVVDLTLSTFSKSLIIPRGIYHLPTLEVEHLELSYSDITTATYSSYNYDVIFAICLPKILTLQCDKKLRKFLRQQWLKKRENRFIKCTWKKYLINAEIEYKKRNGDDWMTLDRKILVADPHIIEEVYTIRFKQIQRNEKNKYSYIPRYVTICYAQCMNYDINTFHLFPFPNS
uniref:F-box domain-containing protein n=1 Tax=Solanum tuberosum TaxID=4113 RepID=M1DV26_SOLTU